MDNFQYRQYAEIQNFEVDKQKKFDDFMTRIEPFNEVYTLEDAKTLASKIVPTSQELTTFFVGNAKCTVVNKEDNFRLSIDTADEFICYDFV